MLSLEVEAQPVPPETKKDHKKELRSVAQGETTAARRDGAQQGDCQRTKRRVQQTPGERTTDRNLGAPSPATVPTISYRSGDTRGEILGKEHKEKTDEQSNEGTCWELNCPSVSDVLEERKR